MTTDIVTKIRTILGNKERYSAKDLAPFDQHHIGGLSSCEILFKALAPKTNDTILDIGSGWGGPARLLSHRSNSKVIGVDIDADNCEIAENISPLFDGNIDVSFNAVDATRFEPEIAINHAYMLHTSMCIKDKEALVKNLSDILPTNGKLVIFDIFKLTSDDELHYPTPWAESIENSFLNTAENMCEILENQNFNVLSLENYDDYALEKVSLGLDLVHKNKLWASATESHLGKNYHQKMQNLHAALLAKKCAPHMIVAIKQ